MTLRSLHLVAIFALIASTSVFAQVSTTPAGNPPPAGQRRAMAPPSNLKVLPRDMSGEKVHAIMRDYEEELGVNCGYCHAKNPATGRNDFASDANPMKERARVMMKMTASINADYLTQLTDPKPANPVDCGTCHRGMAKPTLFVPPPPPPHPASTPPTPPPAK